MNAASQVPSGVLMSTFVSTTCWASTVPVAAAVSPAAAMPTNPRRVMLSLFMSVLLCSLPRRCGAAATVAPLIIPRMAPCAWLTDHAALLPSPATALDVACGRGRHAVWLAERGFSVVALDRNVDALRALQHLAKARTLPIRASVRDLESGAPSLGTATFDVIVVIHYLHRPLIPALLAALRPGG